VLLATMIREPSREQLGVLFRGHGRPVALAEPRSPLLVETADRDAEAALERPLEAPHLANALEQVAQPLVAEPLDQVADCGLTLLVDDVAARIHQRRQVARGRA